MTPDPRPGHEWDHIIGKTVSLAEVRVSLAWHAATELAEGRTPAASVELPRTTRSRRKPATNQASFLTPTEPDSDGQYDQEATPAKTKDRKITRPR